MLSQLDVGSEIDHLPSGIPIGWLDVSQDLKEVQGESQGSIGSAGRSRDKQSRDRKDPEWFRLRQRSKNLKLAEDKVGRSICLYAFSYPNREATTSVR